MALASNLGFIRANSDVMRQLDNDRNVGIEITGMNFGVLGWQRGFISLEQASYVQGHSAFPSGSSPWFSVWLKVGLAPKIKVFTDP